jgi:hypothetical protein
MVQAQKYLFPSPHVCIFDYLLPCLFDVDEYHQQPHEILLLLIRRSAKNIQTEKVIFQISHIKYNNISTFVHTHITKGPQYVYRYPILMSGMN